MSRDNRVRMEYKFKDDSGQNNVFEFAPVPFIQIDREFDLSGKEEIGQTITINVTGTLVAPRHLEGDGIKDDGAEPDYVAGFEGLNILDRLRRKMENILSIPGGEFRVYCVCGDYEPMEGGDFLPPGTQITYFRCYPQVIGTISFQQSPDNWTQTIPYSFQMVYHRTDIFRGETPLYLESIDENWTMEVVDEKLYPGVSEWDLANDPRFTENLNNNALYPDRGSSAVMRLSHTLSATGKKVFGQQTDSIRSDDQLLHEWRNTQAQALNDKVDYATSQPDRWNEPFGRVNTNTANIKTPYQYAKDWILTRLYRTADIDDYRNRVDDFFYTGQSGQSDGDGIFNWTSHRRAYNHVRQKTGNETQGTYSVTESWLIIIGGLADAGATDDYTINYQSNAQTGIDTISIEGTITGFQEDSIDGRDGPNAPNARETKIRKAEKMLEHLLRSNAFYRRVEAHIEDLSRISGMPLLNTVPDRYGRNNLQLNVRNCLNMTPVSKSIRKQIVEGVISYSFEFDTRQNNLFDDTIMESFTTSIVYPADVFTTVVIPGRQKGPLFFSANTQQVPKYTLNYEMVIKPPCIKTMPIDIANIARTQGVNYERGIPQLTNRIRAGIRQKHHYRDRIIAVARAHYDYIREVMGDIIRIEADNDNWNEAEGRYSGSLTFVFGSCQSNYLHPLTRVFKQADEVASHI